ncbi:MAG: hypothetical protein IJE25_07015 [Clostridia bacterium]|nr:hypothetical protein [Clostridia bacterium]
MLFKLIFHDMLADSRRRFILLAISLVSAVASIGAGIGSVAARADGNEQLSLSLELIPYLATLISGVVLIILYISIYKGFHRALYSTEGQLAFTRPVSRGAVLLSKTIADSIWISVFSLLNLGISTVMITTSSASGTLIKELVGESLLPVIAENTALYLPLLLAYGIISSVSGLLIAELAITFGALIPRNHKLICGIGIFFGARSVLSVLADTVSTVLTLPLYELRDGGMALPESALPTHSLTVIVVSLIVDTGVIVGAYLISRLIVNKKLSFR